jgi:hypothetical protein
MLFDIDRDIIHNGQLDFPYDVFVQGRWVASATCYLTADECADEATWRLTMAHAPDVVSDAVNWSDRPDYADPPDPGPGDGTGLGDRGEEGDDPDNPDTLTLCIAALSAAQRGAFGDGATIGAIHRALAAAHKEKARVEQLLAAALPLIIARRVAPLCANCGSAHHVQRCPEVLALLFAQDAPATMPPYEVMVA